MHKEFAKPGVSTTYLEAHPHLTPEAARTIIDAALARWQPGSREQAEAWAQSVNTAFPDDHLPDDYWIHASSQQFRQFFTWGHDHDFGFEVARRGAMGERHIEIATESLACGFLPADLAGQTVLDIGCWSGGDVLMLAGLGATVTAIEEHPRSAASARHLLQLVRCPTTVESRSFYHDQPAWKHAFDLIYCSGVIYHVTDPLLFLRIAFAYLKVGGRLIVETKAMGSEQSVCSYSGTQVHGWNWYAPSPEALGRWLLDAGFTPGGIEIYRRPVGRLLACARKERTAPLPESAGFSRPDSWLEGDL